MSFQLPSDQGHPENASSIYADTEEYHADVMDSRYKKDELYRRRVDAKLDRSAHMWRTNTAQTAHKATRNADGTFEIGTEGFSKANPSEPSERPDGVSVQVRETGSVQVSIRAVD
jgi:hypothetical protein